MARIRYNLDDPAVARSLQLACPLDERGRRTGVVPRAYNNGSRYGSSPVARVVLGDFPDQMVAKADYKEVITNMLLARRRIVDHQHNSWAPPGFKWNQNGLNLCWAWSLTACIMDLEARELEAKSRLLAPTTLAWAVNWRNAGNYLESAISAATERGIGEASYVPDQHSLNYRSYLDGWEENALLHRLSPGDVWDLDNTSKESMIQHCVTILNFGDPIYIAYYWWGHALELVGLLWDESQPYNLVWLIRNSHNEDDIIEMTGARAVPDEAFSPRATVTTFS